MYRGDGRTSIEIEAIGTNTIIERSMLNYIERQMI